METRGTLGTGWVVRNQIALYAFLIGAALVSIIQSLSYTQLPSHESIVPKVTVTTPEEKNDEAALSCLSLDLEGDMDRLLSKYKQVFIIMPAKAAGTSLKKFTHQCMEAAGTPSIAGPKHVLYVNPSTKQMAAKGQYFEQLEMPSLITSHLPNPQAFSSVMKHATRDTLVVYSHRDETSRLLSAVRQVVASRLCVEEETEGITVVDGECQVEEGLLIKVIEEKQYEIGKGGTQLLTCESYDCLVDNSPNVVFVNYKQVSQLQKVLAKHHCPGVESLVSNVAGAKKSAISVVLQGESLNGQLVLLDDWLPAKAPLLELVLQLKNDVSCQATTRGIERKLFACPNEALQISGQSYENQRVQFSFP